MSDSLDRDSHWTPNAGEALGATLLRVFGDDVLVGRARAGDRIAFAALAARYRPALDRLAYRPSETASTGLREQLLATFSDPAAFASHCAPGTWLYLHGIRSAFAQLDVD